jgi:hypothetical protein
MAAVAGPSAGSLTGTGKRGGDGGGKPPRKPTGKGGPTGHYTAPKLKALCEFFWLQLHLQVLTFVFAVGTKQRLDLQFLRETLASIRALDQAGNRPTGLGSELVPFFATDSLLDPIHEPEWVAGKSSARLKSSAYSYSTTLASASRGRVIHTGSSACEECQRGKGNFKDCITASSKNGPLFHGACTSCAFPNRWRSCSFVRNGPASVPVSPEMFATGLASGSASPPFHQFSGSGAASPSSSPRSAAALPSIERVVADSLENSLENLSITPSSRQRSSSSVSSSVAPRQRSSSGPSLPLPAVARARNSNLDHPYGSPAPAAQRVRQGLSDRLIFEHFVDPAITLQRAYDITDCYDEEASGSGPHGLNDYVYFSHYGYRTTGIGGAHWDIILRMWVDYCARHARNPGPVAQPWLEMVVRRQDAARRDGSGGDGFAN